MNLEEIINDIRNNTDVYLLVIIRFFQNLEKCFAEKHFDNFDDIGNYLRSSQNYIKNSDIIEEAYYLVLHARPELVRFNKQSEDSTFVKTIITKNH